MGHIELAAPVAHIWYLRGIPSRMALLLNVAPKSLEEVVYFVSWIVTDPGDTKLEYKQILSEREYRENNAIYGAGSFVAQTGAEAIKTLLEQCDVEAEYTAIMAELEKSTGDKRKKLIKRLETVEAFRNSENKPEWMVLTVLPVIPPDLRPMLQLDGGRFATSDLNDLYRRVITRNNRLKKLLELGTPAIIVQNEKRMLQEAVDALIDNGRRSKAITGAGGRALKWLCNHLGISTDNAAAFGDSLNDVVHGPCLLKATDIEQEVRKHLRTELGVVDFWVELSGIQVLSSVFHSCDWANVSRSGNGKALWDLRHSVTVAHPNGLLLSGAVKDAALPRAGQMSWAILALLGVSNSAAQGNRHNLLSIAETKDRKTKLQNLWVNLRRILRVNRSRAAGQNERRWIELTKLICRNITRNNLGVDVKIAHATCN